MLSIVPRIKVQEDLRRVRIAYIKHGRAAAKFKSAGVDHGKLRIHSKLRGQLSVQDGEEWPSLPAGSWVSLSHNGNLDNHSRLQNSAFPHAGTSLHRV